ncbi:MAG TPA: tripartite tricarboxylate transporter substrate-binding protein, partial [Streptomyces sp.]|nr:tripartite tricarboxylate transporter substrate-binding protein [Streptomyces sp.]
MRRALLLFSLLGAVALAVLLAGVSDGPAQETFPSRPITFVVGFAPGGGADVLGRALADASKTTLPRPLVVENRPGAGGTNAAAYAMGRPPDGYTILFGHAGSTILTPTIGNTPNLKWDAFEPVARIQGEEEFLFLRPGSQWKTIDEVAAFAKQNPGKFRVG